MGLNALGFMVTRVLGGISGKSEVCLKELGKGGRKFLTELKLYNKNLSQQRQHLKGNDQESSEREGKIPRSIRCDQTTMTGIAICLNNTRRGGHFH